MMKTTLWTLLICIAILFSPACESTNDTGAEDDQLVSNEGVVGEDDDALIGEDGWFDDWDGNDDSELTDTEFEEGWREDEVWADWDTDGDGYLDREEWDNGFYMHGDIDADGSWAEAEWNQFTDTYSSYKWGAFTVWDQNEDARLTEEEWEDGLGDSSWFEDWDANNDGKLSQEEFARYSYIVYDKNENGKLDQDEFMVFMEDWG